MFSPIEEILSEMQQGKPVIVVDDESRENEGDLIVAGQFATADVINFMIKEAKGLVCVPMTKERVQALGLEPMHTSSGKDPFKTAWRMSVDAATGITTGISAYDRARTISILNNPSSGPADFIKPGHVFPLEAREGGVLVRAGHTEAAVDLARLAGLQDVGVICEIISDDGAMARLPQLLVFAQKHGLKMCTIASLIEYRRRKEKLVQRVTRVKFPSQYGVFDLYFYESLIDESCHLALVKGPLSAEPTLVRVHSSCFTGDVLGSLRCDCGPQLKESLSVIGREGGVLLYIYQEGRGIGLKNKIRAYFLQDNGADTVQANELLGFPPDLRNYGIGAQMLVDLGIRKIRLLTNNPKKIIGLHGYGLEITERIPIRVGKCKYNRNYLATKRKKLNHIL